MRQNKHQIKIFFNSCFYLHIKPTIVRQYDYYLHAVRKRKRFSRWDKNDKSSKFEVVKEYFGYSDRKTQEVVDLISDEQLVKIKKLIDTGEKK